MQIFRLHEFSLRLTNAGIVISFRDKTPPLPSSSAPTATPNPILRKKTSCSVYRLVINMLRPPTSTAKRRFRVHKVQGSPLDLIYHPPTRKKRKMCQNLMTCFGYRWPACPKKFAHVFLSSCSSACAFTTSASRRGVCVHKSCRISGRSRRFDFYCQAYV